MMDGTVLFPISSGMGCVSPIKISRREAFWNFFAVLTKHAVRPCPPTSSKLMLKPFTFLPDTYLPNLLSEAPTTYWLQPGMLRRYSTIRFTFTLPSITLVVLSNLNFFYTLITQPNAPNLQPCTCFQWSFWTIHTAFTGITLIEEVYLVVPATLLLCLPSLYLYDYQLPTYFNNLTTYLCNAPNSRAAFTGITLT